MKRIRRTEVTVETDEILIISYRAAAIEICPVCAESAGLVAPEQAAALTSVAAETICAWAEADLVHRSRSTNGGLLVCLKSLFGSLGSNRLLEAEPNRRR